MNFLTPTALSLLALSIPILLLWMLKLRRRDVTVSSTMLWSKLLRDREANTPWQKLRRNLLLFLQLAILIALVLALARPFLPVPAIASGAVVLLIDASASMNATDVEPNRFAVAQSSAEEMVRHLGRDGLMTVISVGGQPQVLAAATNDKTVLREAITAAQAGQTPADWGGAFALAAGAISGAAESTIVIISDGNLPSDLPSLPGQVRFVPIGHGEGTVNLALTALAIRDGVNGPELFVNIENTTPAGHPEPITRVLLSIYLDGALYKSRNIKAPVGENKPLIFTGIPEQTISIKARLNVKDALSLDNTAWTLHRPGGQRRALLVSAGNLFLERAIASLPEVEAFRADPAAPLPAETYDLYIFDGTHPAAPETMPTQPSLFINPAPGNPLFNVTGAFSNTQLSRVSNDPLLTHVDFSQVQILQAQQVEVPAWATVLVNAKGGPLLLAGETNGRRVAALTFDLHHSDLPLQIAFPILVSNLVDWLTPGLPFDTAQDLLPGQPLTIYPGDASNVRVTRPDGQSWTAEPDEGALVFAGADQLGLYQVALDGEAAGRFAVNLFNSAESTLSRQEAITIGRAEIAQAGEQELGQRELWPWLAAAALLILLIEWWIYHRGTKKPQGS